MSALLRRLALLAALCIPFASTAMAANPSPINSVLPGRINLVAGDIPWALDAASPGGTVIVVVKDTDNVGMNGAFVELDFTNCASDVRIGAQAFQSGVVNCLSHRVGTYTPATGNTGIATFVIAGGGWPVAGPPHAPGCVSVWANGFFLGNMNVGIYDENGAGGVGAADLSVWAQDWLSGVTRDRSNYDGSPTLGGADLSLWLGVFLAGNSISSPASYCP